MLTPEQIKNHHFRSAGKGLYRSEDVDAFFAQAAEALEKAQESAAELQKNGDELYQRVEALANALNQMRSERELIQKTMISAQKAADELTGQAREESARLLREAQAEAERLRREARDEAAALLGGAKREAEKMLMEAQAHAENLQARAKARAEALFEEARGKAQQELVRISAETQREQQELARLRQEAARFRGGLLDAVARQMELIEHMPFEEAGDRGQGAGEAKMVAKPALVPAAPLEEAKQEPVEAKPEPEPEPAPPMPEPPRPAAEKAPDLFAELTEAWGEPGRSEDRFQLNGV
jgi:cell division septum initiation protein DivIVA